MARINLLPWRQEERARKNKEFNILAGAGATLAILATLIAMTLLNRDLSNQQAANDKITQENARLDGVLTEIADLEKQRDDMIARMKVIQDLQGRRSVPVRVWDDIARAVPSTMYFVNVKREDNVITFTGFAANPDVVSEFVRNLDASPWLANSGVPNIKTSVEAYAQPAVLAPQGQDQTPRAVLPEDSYINFTVTTQVVTDVTTDADGQPIPEGQPPAGVAMPSDVNQTSDTPPPAQDPNAQPQQPAQAQDPNAQPAPAPTGQAPAPAPATAPAPTAEQAPAQPQQAEQAQPTQPNPTPAQAPAGQANVQPAGGQ